MKIRTTLSIFLTGVIILSCCVIFLSAQLKSSLTKLSLAQERRFSSIQFAHELLQSSNNLTNLSRIFVQTENKKHKDYFLKVLKIRNGEEKRPTNYSISFWDFVLAGEIQLLENPTGIKISMEDFMESLHFSSEETAYLHKAKRLSDDLAQIENRAFNLLEGLYLDENGEYTKKGTPNPDLAKKLLYTDPYFNSKSNIMRPIEDFYKSVNERTKRELQKVQKNAKTTLIQTFSIIITLFVLLFVLFLIIHRRILLRIDRLVKISLKITKGDLSSRSQITGKDELGVLGKAFDKMVSQLANTLAIITATKTRMETELNVAKDIQMSMVPLTFPPYPDYNEFDIFATLIPAREVGGDFYDFYFIDENHLCFVVGDVSGKGVPAALMMAVCRTLLKTRAQDDLSTASIITHVNKEMAKENPNCMFITIFIGILNIKTGRVVYTNAGHNPTLIKNKSGEVQKISEIHGPVVGAIEDFAYKESSRTLELGDSIFLYTDGITEAHNSKKELYSEEKLIQFMKDHDLKSTSSFVNAVYEDVKLFEEGLEPFDDITALCLKYFKPSDEKIIDVQTLVIKNELTQINTIIDQFEAFAKKHNLSNKILMKIHLVLDDVVSNIIRHAYSDDGDADDDITIEFKLYPLQLFITTKDQGIPFNPLLTKIPNSINLPPEDRALGGLGIHLVKNIMDDCHYRRKINQNILTLIKKL